MSAQEDINLLEDYNRWVGEKKMSVKDFSPEAYVIDKAKEQAFEELEALTKRVHFYEACFEAINTRIDNFSYEDGNGNLVIYTDNLDTILADVENYKNKDPEEDV